MTKAKKPDTTLADEVTREIRKQQAIEYQMDRWRWLNGMKPFQSDPVATTAARKLEADAKATAKPVQATKPKWGAEYQMNPVDRAALMMSDPALFPDGIADISITELTHKLAQECKRHGIKTWERDTTARARKALKAKG